MGTVIGDDRASGARPGSRLLPPKQLISVVAAVVVVAGLITLGFTPFSAGTASTPPLALKQVWLHYLDDAPCGVAEASPAEVSLDQSSVEIGDREGYLYAFHLSDGSVPAAWAGAPASASVGSGEACGIAGNDEATAKPALGTNGIAVAGNPPIDSTASVASTPYGSFIYFGAGNAADPGLGGYYAYGPSGHLLWSKAVTNPPTDPLHDIGVQASPTLVTTNTTPFVTAGSLGQESYAFDASTGSSVSGWPYFSADSVFSTAAVADLYGTGQDELVVGGASTDGVAYGRHYQNGGHLRILSDDGGLICSANTNEEIDSSPAIGPILPGGALGIATGTGSYYSGSDEDTVKVFDTQCNQVWSKTLDGTTGGSPALADLSGNGQLDVVEGTSTDDRTGSVWALDASTGAVLWKVPALGAVLGSVTTADLSSDGAQDVIVATTAGLEILDGKTGDELVHVDDGSGDGGVAPGTTFGFQNAPLVTDDPDGLIGITVAGYDGVSGSPDHDVQGVVQHFTVPGSDGALVAEAGRLAAVPPRFTSDRVHRYAHHPAGRMSDPSGRPRRLPGGRGRRGRVQLREPAVLWECGGRPSQRTGGGRRHFARPRRVLAGGVRRRRVQLRRALLRVGGGSASEAAGSSAWQPRPTGAATGWSRATGGSLPLATPRTTARAPLSPMQTSWGWLPRRTGRGIGR